MAPVRKSRSVNKRLPYTNEVSPSKGGNSPSKSNKRKRKVSDMLGPQWSKEELQRFYEAYRKYGKDWKKVAAAVRNRSLEMVEALYTMNRAYLSLPEGTASVVGLIAMMTDHYSILEGSESEQESNDGVGTVRKPHKRPRGKLQPKTRGLDRHLSDGSRSQSLPTSYGCLSLLKKRRPDGNQPRAVGKRTPRIPVRYTHDSIEKYISPPKQGQKSKLDADNDDDDVAHEVALTLAEASHRGGSPQASQTPNRKKETATTSPAAFGERRCSESEMSSAKNTGNEIADDACEGSLGSTEGNNKFHREKPHFTGRKIGGTSVQQNPRKSYGKKVEIEDSADHDVDDIREACSGTEEGQKFSSFDSKLGAESRNLAFVRPPGQASKKRSKKVLFGGDESVALDALQALADLSFMMPSTAEAESTVPFREGKESDIAQSRPQKIVFARTKQRASPSKNKRDQPAHNTEVLESKTVKCGKFSVPDSRLIEEMKDPGIRRRKQKSSVLKTSVTDVKAGADESFTQKELSEQGIKPVTKSRRSSQNASRHYLGQLVKSSEHCSSSTDIKKEGDDQAVSHMQAPANINVNSLTKSRSRRKLNKEHINRNSRDLKNLETLVNDKSNASRLFSLDNIDRFKEKLTNCLSNYRVRRWCVCEWFYSAIDYPWFAKSEFVEYLYHVGLGHVPRLTRVEWGVIRSSLGKPRRFSEQFLKEEKEKLNYYRESVRHHYTELSMGKREGLPADLARPLTVGQRVISIHPQTREVHNGSILTVDHNRCRVQFDKPDLGVEFVKDIDCMPLNPLENMPTSLKRHNIVVDKLYEALKQFNVAERSDDRMKEDFSKITPSHKVEIVDGASDVSPGFLTNNMSKHAKEGFVSPNAHCKVGHSELVSPQQAIIYKQSALSQIQAKEADIRALAELTRALDKKNALVNELKRMNDDVSENSSLKGVDSFKKQYAAVLVQLNEILDQVSSALLCLRQRNTYQGNSGLTGHKPMSILEHRGNIVTPLNCLPPDSQETGSQVYEIVDSSRVNARKMVDAVLQVVSQLKEAANLSHKVANDADRVTNWPSVDKSTLPLQATELNGSLSCQNQAYGVCSNKVSSDGEAQVPSELISNCVSTLLMIQKCTERQFPPAEVAQILDFAVTSLQPRCSQNLPVYSEIQKCMGIIRNQILALIPT
ncbi:protein ALWAYS EARLY 3 isoform X2 [Silene latifolia]|uniref:protein ALWAYS EARLY 3 isoform X2 n=1 Tax=Silene latifolia TaxID=37657 RepID=UPI003D76ED01